MEKIRGYIKIYIFSNEESGFRIAKIKSDSDTYTTISGYFPQLSKEQLYEFSGQFKNHSKYGLQFSVVNYKTVIDDSLEGIVNYLSSNLFTGIGIKTAQKIYDTLGSTCISIILNDKSVLDQFNFNEEKKELFYNQLFENRYMEDVLISLYDYGIMGKTAMKLYSIYSTDTIKVIEENPYRLIKEVDGIGFLKADEIALKVGIEKNSSYRIKAGILYTLEYFSLNEGNSYIMENKIISLTSSLFKDTIQESLIQECYNSLLKENEIIKEEEKIYLKLSYYTEKKLATNIKRFSSKEFYSYSDSQILSSIENHDIKYTQKQKEAILTSLKAPISIITGGPGTGKTTIINGILKVYNLLNNKKDKKIILCAPTGKAAKRMNENTKFPSCTIHKALGYDFTGKFKYDEDNQLYCDLIIIDEVSMIDMFLANQLFKSLDSNCQIVLVGDEDQLPSVGPGNILKDLISSDIINTTRLKEIHRQAKESNIISLSQAIKEESIYEINFDSHDLRFIKSTDILSNILDLVSKNKDIQILCPMYKGYNGIDIINEKVQELINPNNDYMTYGDKLFRINDKVLQTENNPRKELMNGDIGIVKDIVIKDDEKLLLVEFDNKNELYRKEELSQLTLSYAISVHKSQGSEYSDLILVMARDHYIMLNKKLIYTAITRAKNKLYIIGDFNIFLKGISGISNERLTSLQARLTDFNKKSNLEDISPYDFL